MKFNHITTFVLVSLLLCLCSGCKGNNDTTQTDVNDSSITTEDAGNDEYYTNSIDETNTEEQTEEQTEEPVCSIADSDYALKDYGVDGTDNLYTLHINAMSDEMWIASISEYGEDVLLVYYEYGDNMDSINYYMEIINPLTLEESEAVQLPEGTYVQSDISVDEDNNILIINKEKSCAYFYNDKLEEYKEADLGDSYINTYCASSDFQNIYYMVSEKNEVYQYNVATEETNAICQNYMSGEDGYGHIMGMLENEEAGYILLETIDPESSESTYNLYNIETGEAYVSNMPGADYVGNVEYIVGDSNNYLVKCRVDGVAELVSNGNVISLSDYNEYDYVNDDLSDRKLISALSDHDTDMETDTFQLKIYDMDTGLIENESEFTFNDTYYSYMYAGETLYMKDMKLVVWQASDSCDGIFVWDLTEEDSKSEDESNHLYTWEDLVAPDENSVNQLREKANKIGQETGVEVYVSDDVFGCTQTIYEYMPVNNVVRIDKALDILEKELARYPEGMLEQLDDSYGSKLKIYLSGKILPLDDTGIDTAIGVQDTLEDDTWLVIDITSIADYTQTIHHEILHAIELHMNNEGYFFYEDEWNEFNPSGFYYDNDYIANVDNFDFDYIIGDLENSEEISFIDTYSKSYSKEDRARIMEYAMMEEERQTGYFQYKNIHDKLEYISEKLREAFDITGWPEVTEWEKVLQELDEE